MSTRETLTRELDAIATLVAATIAASEAPYDRGTVVQLIRRAGGLGLHGKIRDVLRRAATSDTWPAD